MPAEEAKVRKQVTRGQAVTLIVLTILPLAAAALFLRHDRNRLKRMRLAHEQIKTGMRLAEVRRRLPEGSYRYNCDGIHCAILSPAAFGGTYFVVLTEADMVTGKREGS